MRKRRSEDSGIAIILAIILIAGITFDQTIRRSRHTVDYTGHVVSIEHSSGRSEARIITEKTGMIIPLTMSQVDSIKAGDVVTFTLEFNGWGTCQRTKEITKK